MLFSENLISHLAADHLVTGIHSHIEAQSFHTLDSTEQWNINKTCLDCGAKKVMQPPFTPKWVGIFIYVLIVEGSRNREGQKFLQDHPVSPSFDPLAPYDKQWRSLSCRACDQCNQTCGSKYDSLSPLLPPPCSCQKPAGFLWSSS